MSLPTTLAEAEMALLLIRQEIDLMGANDFEIPTINDLIDSLYAGGSPDEAVEQASQILSRKATYH
jgi:hypothetical protein